jgi:hypothetical protein
MYQGSSRFHCDSTRRTRADNKLLQLFKLDWDRPPERRPPPRPEQRRPPPRPRRTTLYFDGSIRRHRRRSRWNTIGRLVFRAGVSVVATAVCVVLSAVVVGGIWFLVVLFKAASRVDNPYPKIAAAMSAIPPAHTRNYEEMVALVRQLYPNLDDPHHSTEDGNPEERK